MDGPPLVPSGPRKITPKNQVTVPGELLEATGLQVGDDVFLVLNPDRSGTILILPRALMAEVFRKGWTALS
ncbi:MAG TPA: AbrB/MazE/SpoVT family DNA-binding domain-containing protein [Acidimicrobiales bacterium]|nr:AbrB/MazE/SpoVT family DNA-binding domain-containing protein [Acidimicrobiales bacterium]